MGLPRYVVEELEDYVGCGDLSRGFVRARCEACARDLLIAFSCKGRGACPSCASRRMANLAAHLVDRVLPPVPVRQWVLSLPFELRHAAAFDPQVLTALSRIFAEAIAVSYRRRHALAGVKGLVSRALSGAVTFVQRFGGSVNLNVHFHVVALDGVYVPESEAGRLRFDPAAAPDRKEVARVVEAVQRRAVAWLRRTGRLVDAEGGDEIDAAKRAPPDAVAACARVAMRGGSFATLRDDKGDGDEGEEPHEISSAPVAARDGFNVHAGVRIAADDDRGRERLCRYGARPPLALGRLRRLRDGRIAYRMKHARPGGPTHRLMTPHELLARIAALVPPPRYPLVRYHGVLAPNSPHRGKVVPRVPEPPAPPRRLADARQGHERLGTKGKRPSGDPPTEINPARLLATPFPPSSLARNLPGAELVTPHVIALAHWARLDGGTLLARAKYVDWATLMRRTWEIDVTACVMCGGRLEVIEVVSEKARAAELLDELERGSFARAPPAAERVRARTA